VTTDVVLANNLGMCETEKTRNDCIQLRGISQLLWKINNSVKQKERGSI